MDKHIFKKGDRVRYIGNHSMVNGREATLERIDLEEEGLSPSCELRFDDGLALLTLQKCIEKIGPAAPAPITDLTLRQLQTNLPWSIRYSRDFRASPIAHKDFAHALTHVGKAAGFLHALVDDMDHDRSVADDSAAVRERAEKYIADLVICAMRMANTLPGGVLDLQRAVQHRIESKNGVKLPTGD